MPYIIQSRRKELDPYIDKLIEEAIEVGELNYIISKLLYDSIKAHRNYSAYNSLIGVLECAKLELFRMALAKYEDKKIELNGRIYEG